MSDTNNIEKEDFPSNSYKIRNESAGPSKEIEPKKVSKVVTGRVLRKKKGFLDKFTEIFFGDDAKSVGNYILFDVLIPAAKNTVSEMVSSGIEMLLFGESKGSATRRDKGHSYVSYGSFYNRGNRSDRQGRSDVARIRANHRFDDIIIETRGEAEEVLSNLVEMIEQYDVATVADFYDMVGITGEYSDNNYGWTNLSRATVDRVRHGYVLSLPKPVEIE